MPRRRCRVGGIVLLAPLACAALAGAGGAAAAQEVGTLAVRVVLDDLTPAAPGPGDQLRVTGRVQTGGDAVVRDVTVRLRLAGQRIGTRSELAALGGGQTVPADRGIDAGAVVLGDLGPGATGSFVLTLPVDRLGLGGFGVYPLAVEARGGPPGGRSRVGITRTVVTWSPDPVGVEPTRLVWLWPLADRPRRLADGTFADDTLAQELAPGGRVASLAAAAAGHAVTWVVDPMLLEDARDMSDGYLLRGAGGSVPGGGDEAARTFLDQLPGQMATGEVIALPYAAVDVVAVLRADQVGLLAAAVTLGRELAAAALGPAVGGEVAVPEGGFLDDRGAAALASLGYRSVVLTEAALPRRTAGPTLSGRAVLDIPSGGSMDALLLDGALSDAAAQDTGRAGTRVLAEQRFIAETAMITAERPGDSRTVAVMPPTRWSPRADHAGRLLDLTVELPWLAPVGLRAGLATPVPDLRREELTYPDTAADAELPAAHLREIADLTERVAGLTSMLSDPAALLGGAAAERLRLASAGLRELPEVRRDLLAASRGALAAVEGGVRVLPATVSLGTDERGLAVSVVNHLDQEVTVSVRFSTDSPRLSVEPTEPVTVGPGRIGPVTATARAVANGQVAVQAQVLTPTGTPIGPPTILDVRVAQYGVAAVVVTIGAAVLLFAAAARNTVRRIRVSRRAGAVPR